ncbi:hypothetical protein BH18THE2_BH18THE2_14550 [soil metagenome]
MREAQGSSFKSPDQNINQPASIADEFKQTCETKGARSHNRRGVFADEKQSNEENVGDFRHSIDNTNKTNGFLRYRYGLIWSRKPIPDKSNTTNI